MARASDGAPGDIEKRFSQNLSIGAGTAPISILRSLRKAVAQLAMVDTLLTEMHAEVPTSGTGDDVAKRLEGGPFPQPGSAEASPQAISSLRSVRRSLEDIVHLIRVAAEAQNPALDVKSEDVLVQEILRQHGRALEQREASEAACAQERRSITAVRGEITNVKNLIAGAAHSRKEWSRQNAARSAALERCKMATEGALEDVAPALKEMGEAVVEAATRNGETLSQIARLQNEHDAAVEENKRAQLVLGNLPNADAYRMIKQRERSAADEALDEAAREIEDDMAHSEALFAERHEAIRAAMEEFCEDAAALKARLESARAEAEGSLKEQASSWNRMAEELDRRTAKEMRDYEGLRQQKTIALNREAAEVRMRIKEEAAMAQSQMAIKQREAQLQAMKKAQAMKEDFLSKLKKEQRAVVEAKKEADLVERQAVLQQEKFRAHAVKTHDYMMSLDPKTRQGLQQTWTKVGRGLPGTGETSARRRASGILET